jgi:hypothetical protein
VDCGLQIADLKMMGGMQGEWGMRKAEGKAGTRLGKKFGGTQLGASNLGHFWHLSVLKAS